MVVLSKLGIVEFSAITEETVDESNSVTSKPIETGSQITDNVRTNPTDISITGQITGSDAAQKLSVISGYRRDASRIPYIGRNAFNDVVITAINRSHGPNIRNGFEFTIKLRVLRIALKQAINIDLTRISLPQIKVKSRNGTQSNQIIDVDNDALLAKIIEAGGYITDDPGIQSAAQQERLRIQ